jgi:transcriptional regulator with XRE-family HTH domain
MTPRPRLAETVPSRGGEIERRFSWLLDRMRNRYLNSGYELDDVHLAEILGVHPGVLRKGKFFSVSPSLAQAAALAWGVDLNWLLLGRGLEPPEHGYLPGLDRLPRETRVARGRWNDTAVRQLLRIKRLSQKDVAGHLGIPQARAGAVARGQLRDPELRERLAGLLDVPVEKLFLVSDSGRQQEQINEPASTDNLYNLSMVRAALNSLLDERLEQALENVQRKNSGVKFVPDGFILTIPSPPSDVSEPERKRYERNREVLERWSHSRGAFHVPPEVAGRYCREVVGFYDGGRMEDVGGILRDFMLENEPPGGK